MDYVEIASDNILYFNIPLSNERIWANSAKGGRKSGWRLQGDVKQFLYGCKVYDRDGWMFYQDPSRWGEWDTHLPQPGMFHAITNTASIRSRGGIGTFTPGLMMNLADKSAAAMFKLAWL